MIFLTRFDELYVKLMKLRLFVCLFVIHKRDSAVFDIVLGYLSNFYPMFSYSASPISIVY